jgi:hypothetical protein
VMGIICKDGTKLLPPHCPPGTANSLFELPGPSDQNDAPNTIKHDAGRHFI